MASRVALFVTLLVYVVQENTLDAEKVLDLKYAHYTDEILNKCTNVITRRS